MASKNTRATEINASEAATEGVTDAKVAETEMPVPNNTLEKILLQQQEMIRKLQEEIMDMKAGKAEAEKPVMEEDPEWKEIRETAQKAAEEGQDPWSIEVFVMVPRKKPGEDQNHWLNINGQRLQVPTNGRRQKMKLPFALLLIDMLKAEETAAIFEENIPNYDVDDNPKR